jgi:hypothetical protein
MSKGSIGTFVGAAIGFIVTAGNPLGAQIGDFIPGVVCSNDEDEKPLGASEAE